jgi:nucleotidyltransferase/DNA polymerase involved in DNA repair
LGGTEKLWGKALDTASRISKDIRESFPSPLSVGTSSGKTVSHIAASLARPSGIISVNHGCEQDFIFPQPIFLLPGIGHKTATRLSMLGIMNIGELTKLSTSDSLRLFGQKGSLIRNTVLGDNESETLRTENTLKIRTSVINPEDSELLEKAVSTLMKASAQVGFRLRLAELSAEKVELTVLYSDGLVRKLSGISKKELWTDNSIFSFALPLLKRIHSEKRTRIRTISLNLSDLGTGHLQTGLFQDSDKGDFLQSALDSIRSKYGDNAVKNALTMI